MVGIILQLEGVEIQRGVVFFDLSEVDHFAGEGVVVVLIINDNNDGSDMIVVMMVEVRWWIDIRSQRGINFLPPCNPPLLVPLLLPPSTPSTLLLYPAEMRNSRSVSIILVISSLLLMPNLFLSLFSFYYYYF